MRQIGVSPNSVPEVVCRLLTVPDVARLLRVSRRTVIRWFEREPGVIVFDRPEKMHKRRHRTLRIPEPVYIRVLEQKKLR